MTANESKGRFFFTKRIDSHNESIQIANWNALLSGGKGGILSELLRPVLCATVVHNGTQI